MVELQDKLPVPENEEARLAALMHYEIMDSDPESQFDDLTQLAAEICGVPISLVSLVDGERQWFKSVVGLGAKETPREISFCQYAIMEPEIFEVENALEDDRFESNPLVTDDPSIRFYAGAPLIDENGHALGTLCVIDSSPKVLTPAQRTSLRAIANTVIRLIEYRKESIEKEKFRQFFNMSRDCMSIASNKGFMEEINPSFRDLLGYTIDELNAKKWTEFIHPQEVEQMKAMLLSLSPDNPTVSILSRFKVKNDGWKWLSWLCTLHPKSGRIFSVARDETHSIEMDARLENELKAINNSVIRIEYNLDGHVLQANERCLKVLKFEPKKVLEKTYKELWLASGEGGQDPSKTWDEIIKTGAQKNEFLTENADGQKVWLKGAFIPVKNIDGEVVRVIQLAYDVTREKEMSKELLSLSNFQEGILDGTRHSIICTDLDGTIKLWNKGATELLGYTADEIVDKENPGLIHDIDEVIARAEVLTEELGFKVNPGFETFVVKAREQDVADENEWTYIHKDGTRIPVWLSVTALRDSKGEVESYLGIAVDSTEMKRMEKSLKQAKELAEESLMAKEVFLANMSHEIRTPLNAIVGFSNLLKEKELEPEAEGYVSAVAIASRNLLRLINDVLDLSKIEDDKIELEDKPLNLRELCTDTLNLNSQLAEAKNLELVEEIDPDLPEFVMGDSTRITQILTNLLGNAIKFTQDGTVTLGVKVEEQNENAVSLRMSVRDTGIGIPKEKLDVIFDRFIQAESSTTREYGGSGLGLNIVKKLVKLKGGEIHVDSTPGEGSEFWFTISLDIPSEQQVNKEFRQVQKSAMDSLDGIRILLAEDNDHNQILATTYIRRNQGIVDVAENGAIALDMIQKDQYDIVLMDLQMPKMDGFQATEMIRRDLKLEIPIVACTANSLVGEKDKSMKLGMNDYITKPYTERDLVQTIWKHTKNRQGSASVMSDRNPISEELKMRTQDGNSDNVHELLDAMEAEEGKDFTDSMVGLLLKRLPDDIEVLEEGILDQDREALSKKAHLLAGTLATFQFTVGNNLARTAEQSAKEGAESYCKDAQKLVDYLKQMIYDINSRIDQRS